MITIHQRHRQTDGRTDRRDRNTARCTKVHRAVTTWASDFKFGGNAELRMGGIFPKSGRDIASLWGTWRLNLYVVFVGCTGADRRTLRDEWRLTGAIVCVITKSAILIQHNLLFRHVICSWSKIKSRYVSICLTIAIWLSGSAYCEVVWSAILATAWLLVFESYTDQLCYVLCCYDEIFRRFLSLPLASASIICVVMSFAYLIFTTSKRSRDYCIYWCLCLCN